MSPPGLEEGVRVRCFTRYGGPWQYRGYSSLVYDIFTCSQGWDFSADHDEARVRPGPGDDHALFCSAIAGDRTLAAARGSAPGAELPLGHLYREHLQWLRDRNLQASAITNLCVVPELRGVHLPGPRRRTLAGEILTQLRQGLKLFGADAIVMTTGVVECARLALRHGFRLLDPAAVVNGPVPVAVSLGWAPEESPFLDYLRGREREVVGARRPVDYVTEHLLTTEQSMATDPGATVPRAYVGSSLF